MNKFVLLLASEHGAMDLVWGVESKGEKAAQASVITSYGITHSIEQIQAHRGINRSIIVLIIVGCHWIVNLSFIIVDINIYCLLTSCRPYDLAPNYILHD